MFKHFITAGRPQTLICSMAPVVTAFFISNSKNYLIFSLTLLCAICLQILANWVNDLYDFKKGGDQNRKNRMVASGNISERKMTIAIIGLIILIVALGGYLTWYGGTKILIIGILSILGALVYTIGKYALAYIGLGEFAVLTFFGLIPAYGSFLLFNYNFSVLDLILASVPSLVSTAVIVVNNIRDLEDDRSNNKKTLATRIGLKNSEFEYLFFIFLAGTIPSLIFLFQYKILASIIILIFFFFTRNLTDLLFQKDYQKLLPSTAKLNIFLVLLIVAASHISL